MQTIEETELKMPSDFRWHSFLVSAGYLPDTIFWLQWIGDLQKSVKQYTIFWSEDICYFL